MPGVVAAGVLEAVRVFVGGGGGEPQAASISTTASSGSGSHTVALRFAPKARRWTKVC